MNELSGSVETVVKEAANTSEAAFFLAVAMVVMTFVIVIVVWVVYQSTRQQNKSSNDLAKVLMQSLAKTNEQHVENGRRHAICIDKLAETDDRLCVMVAATSDAVERIERLQLQGMKNFLDALLLAEKYAVDDEKRNAIRNLIDKFREELH